MTDTAPANKKQKTMATTMQCARVHGKGGPESIKIDTVDVPVPGAGEVVVKTAYAGVNYIDTYHRKGLYPVAYPFTLGREGSGVVHAVGAGVDTLKVGARVAWFHPSSYSEYVLLKATAPVAIPDAMSMKDAGGAMLQGLTAHYLTSSSYAIQRGDTVLVHAGAGGTGRVIIQMAKLRGATVLTTVSTPAKAAIAKAAGADHVINYVDDDFAAEVLRLTDGKKCACVYDGVGAATWEKSLASVAPLGMLVCFGNASGAVPPINPLALAKAGSVSLLRPRLPDYLATPEIKSGRIRDLFKWIAAGDVKLNFADSFPLTEARQAHEYLESRKAAGKIVLVCDASLK